MKKRTGLLIAIVTGACVQPSTAVQGLHGASGTTESSCVKGIGYWKNAPPSAWPVPLPMFSIGLPLDQPSLLRILQCATPDACPEFASPQQLRLAQQIIAARLNLAPVAADLKDDVVLRAVALAELLLSSCLGGQLGCHPAFLSPFIELLDALNSGAASLLGEPCGFNGIGECRLGTIACRNDRLTCDGVKRPTPEVCDGLDHDCDGVPNNGCCPPGTMDCGGGMCSMPGAPCFPPPPMCPGDPSCPSDCNPPCQPGDVCLGGVCQPGGGGGTASVVLSPDGAIVQAFDLLPLNAVVTGMVNPVLSWSAPNGSSIKASGPMSAVFAAPQPGTYQITVSAFELASPQPLPPVTASVIVTVLPRTLVAALSQGGHVLYFRHGQATCGADNTSGGDGWWKSCCCDPTASCCLAPPDGLSCDGQPIVARQLDPVGVDQAENIGKSLSGNGIPVSEVISSEFCRAWRTATAMNLGPVQQVADLNFLTITAEKLQPYLRSAPPSGNKVLVAHVTGVLPELGSLQNAQAAVYRPFQRADGGADYLFLLTVTNDQWPPPPPAP